MLLLQLNLLVQSFKIDQNLRMDSGCLGQWFNCNHVIKVRLIVRVVGVIDFR